MGTRPPTNKNRDISSGPMVVTTILGLESPKRGLAHEKNHSNTVSVDSNDNRAGIPEWGLAHRKKNVISVMVIW